MLICGGQNNSCLFHVAVTLLLKPQDHLAYGERRLMWAPYCFSS